MGHIYSDPTFQMACEQFRLIADHLQMPEDLKERLAAMAIGVERVMKARQVRGLFP